MPRFFRDTIARLILLAMPIVAWDKRYYRLWKKAGFNITPDHFYYPIPNIDALENSIWKKESELIGIELNQEKQLMLLNQVFPRYKEEYNFPFNKTNKPYDYYFNNGSYGAIDAEVLHSIIRFFKPKKIVEVGSGYSTYLSARACLLNKKDTNENSELIAIEPYPNDILKKGFPGLTTLIQKPLEKIGIDFFSELKDRDILFIDSTHVLKIGGDVKYLYLEVLPRLSKGVIIHCHDVFLPMEYPKNWIVGNHWFWTEQYLIQAFLAFNSAFEVLWASQYMNRRYPQKLKQIFNSYNEYVNPGSLWIRRIE